MQYISENIFMVSTYSWSEYSNIYYIILTYIPDIISHLNKTIFTHAYMDTYANVSLGS